MITRRPPTRICSPAWPFPCSVVEGRRGIVQNIQPPKPRVQLQVWALVAKDPATAPIWPFETSPLSTLTARLGEAPF